MLPSVAIYGSKFELKQNSKNWLLKTQCENLIIFLPLPSLIKCHFANYTCNDFRVFDNFVKFLALKFSKMVVFETRNLLKIHFM